MNIFKNNKPAFTLAEVLITLGIIGIISAITIPNLIQKQQEQRTVTALKKAYSTLSSAYSLAVQENGTPEQWNLVATNSGQGALNMLNTLAPYLRITKNCGYLEGCSPVLHLRKSGDAFYTIDKVNGFAKAELADGILLFTSVYSSDCSADWGTGNALKSVCGSLFVDINGLKPPNKIASDLFFFQITKYGIVPTGNSNYTYSGVSFSGDCAKKPVTGYGCTAWVIYNENMDYLHCDDLSWDGKKKCD